MRARLGLLLAAFIWGFSFVLQRIATTSIGPFGFNFIRFLLAAIMLIPISKYIFETKPMQKAKLTLWQGGALCGIFMFAGAVLQQAGLAYTTVGKTAFITALYIVIVPIMGLFLNHSLKLLTMAGVISAVIDTALLTDVGSSQINYGDFLILCSTICWAAQIVAMGYLAPRHKCIQLTAIQFLVAGILNGFCVFFFEPLTITMIHNALIPILYGGIMTLGVEFTLQTIFQQTLPPTETALILSTEMIFASVMGFIFLGEHFSTIEFIGVLFISFGIILAELPYGNKYAIPPLPIWKK